MNAMATPVPSSQRSGLRLVTPTHNELPHDATVVATSQAGADPHRAVLLRARLQGAGQFAVRVIFGVSACFAAAASLYLFGLLLRDLLR